MKYYRLSQSDTRYGHMGFVIPQEPYKAVSYVDRALFDKIDEFGTGYPYQVAVARYQGHANLYYLESYPELIILVDAIMATLRDKTIMKPVIPIAESGTLAIGNEYIVAITYRSQWDNAYLATSSPPDTR